MTISLSLSQFLNTLSYDKILDVIKSKAFADDKLNVNKMFDFSLSLSRKHYEKIDKMSVTTIFSFSHSVF